MTISIIIMPSAIYQEDPENSSTVQGVNQPPCNLGSCHLEGLLAVVDCTLRVTGAEGVNLISWRGKVFHWRFSVLKFYSTTQQVACDFREANEELQCYSYIPVKDIGSNSKQISHHNNS
ncbi:unnamed protein product, partial [Bubo scandiacus]